MSQMNVAFSNLYLSSVSKQEAKVQAKVNNMVLKLMSNPDLPGLNLEKIHQAKDPSIRSIRVDLTYRVILSVQNHGKVLLLLWVDHHDAAYEWAASHKCQVNPNTGVIQIYQAELGEEHQATTQMTQNPSAFESLKDRELLKLGVPEELLARVRAVSNESELDVIQSILPADAYESLFFFMAGQSYEDILADKEQQSLIEQDQSFDTDDFQAALARLQTRAGIFVPADERELNAMMNASLEKWRVFLHPSQRSLVEGDKNGAVRVLGGAGTGKTVAAMHRAKWLAQRVAAENKILLTTFTRNLAQDISHNLKTICGDELDRIEVINLDRWVSAYLKKQGYDYQIAFDQSQLNECWHRAYSEKSSDLDLPISFFQEEWQQVVQSQGIDSAEAYKKASRLGRGTKLSREQKLLVWQVFEVYRSLLNRQRLKEVDDAYRDAASLITSNALPLPYRSIIVDEAQDMGMPAFRLLRAMVPEGANDLFIVGDAHQRIYGKKLTLSKAGINIRGRSKKLKINYRTTDEIRQYAVGLLSSEGIDDLDGGSDSNRLYKSLTHGPAPQVEHFFSAAEQAIYIKQLLVNGQVPAENCCIAARTNNEVAQIAQLLENSGVKTYEVKASDHDAPLGAVKLATFHRVKGLEFDRMILASINDGLVPLTQAINNLADETARHDALLQEKALMYVALTRAKKDVFVLSYGTTSQFIST